MNSDETNKKVKTLLDLAEKLGDKDTGRNYEYRIIAGRQVPTPSFSIKPKTVVVKPKEEDEEK